MSRLAVWIEGRRVGQLDVERGDWRFTYEAAWLADPATYPISPHLPLDAQTYRDDQGEHRTVRWFFDNLLPEGGVRQALARHARIAADDSFSFLSTFGRESAGALTLLPPDEPSPPTADTYDPLDREELRALVLDQPGVPLIAAGGRARMSLAGAQHKLALHRDAHGWLLPQGAAASSLIVKPDNARAALFPFCPANEHFCMTLARQLGLTAPPCELERLPEPLFVVERFDRRVHDGSVERLHQIDLCQLLNLWAGVKYESDGGPGLVETYRALERTRQPAVSRSQWLRWLIFNYAIGNSDAHAKNVSFLVDPRGIFLAPAYDLLSVAVYGDEYDYMAMTIEDEVRYGWVEPRHWDALATAFGLAPAFLKRLRHTLAHAITAPARELASAAVYTAEESALLANVVALIERHANYLLADA